MAEKDDVAMKERSEDDSDVELEGVDMEDDDDVEYVEEAVAVEGIAATNNTTVLPTDDVAMAVEQSLPAFKEIDDEAATALAADEAAEMEAARKERLELLKADEEAQATQPPADAQSRLDYLLHQSDVFAHFLAGSVAATTTSKASGKGGKGRGKGRLTEEEEDAQLLKSAQSKRRVVRLDHQPACLAPICKMHPYQLEGLNWLIKLHDHGINAILADGTYLYFFLRIETID